MLIYFTKVAAAIHSSIDMVFFRRTLAGMNCVYAMYLTTNTPRVFHVEKRLLHVISTWNTRGVFAGLTGI